MLFTRRLPLLSKNLSRVLPNLRRCKSSIHSLVPASGHVEPSCNKDHNPHWWEEASLYVHWPYCKKRCTYCNFNKYIASTINQDRMRACLVREVKTLIQLSGVERITSIFFGGGTPSLAEPWVLEGVIDAAQELVVMPTDFEISMEANPTSIEMKRLEDYRSAGVNRLSLGIQALNSEDLKTLGREHTVNQSLICIQEARKLFPDRLSIDVIFGRPSQTLDSWKVELEQILAVCDNHISLYQLTLEPGTLLYKWDRQGVLPMPNADVIADMYETAVERLAQAGFHRYEVSNFAKNERAESTHNKSYWAGKQYIGIGPGAHGRFCPITEQVAEQKRNERNMHSKLGFNNENSLKERTKGSTINLSKFSDEAKCNIHSIDRELSEEGEKSKTTLDIFPTLPQREARIQTLEPEPWMHEVEKHGHATRKRSIQSNADILRELLLTGLRTHQGVSNQTWQQFNPGVCLRDVFGSSEFVKEAMVSGLLELDDTGLRCTHQGLNVLDSLLPDLTSILEAHYETER